VVVGKGRPVGKDASGKKEDHVSEKNSFYSIDLIIELTIEILKSVERFNVQNTRAPALFVTLSMGTWTGGPRGINNATSPPSTERPNEPELLGREKVVI
jgi:hypothetical protein